MNAAWRWSLRDQEEMRTFNCYSHTEIADLENCVFGFMHFNLCDFSSFLRDLFFLKFFLTYLIFIIVSLKELSFFKFVKRFK